MKRIMIVIILTVAALAAVSAAMAWELKWYGQSAFKISTPGGKVVLIDPFITGNPVTPDADKNLGKLGPVDLILLTHAHGDHVGDTAEIVAKTGARVALNADLGHTFGTLDIVPYKQLIRFNKSGPIEPIQGIRVTMVRAEHSSELLHTDPASGRKIVYPGGEPAGYIIELENGFRIYHAGDTGVFADMAYIRDFHNPDLALLPIGGHFTMDPAHAAYAVNSYLKTPEVIPMHYGTFPPLKGTPKEFIKALGATNTTVVVLQPGHSRQYRD